MDVELLPHPLAFPTLCVFCGTHAHPDGFVDRGIVLPMYGRVYECAGCTRDAGKAIGMVDGSELRDALEANVAQAVHINELNAMLEIEREPGAKVVSVEHIPAIVDGLARVIDLEAERKKRKPKATSAA